MALYFVLWTGGLDSTALVHRLLTEGHSVTVGYVVITNNEEKSKRELAATRAMSKILKEEFPDTFGDWNHISTMSINQGSMLALQQPLMFLTSLAYAVSSTPFDYVAIGYVLNDSAVSYLADLVNIWKSFKPLFLTKQPQLVFPNIKIGKQEEYDNLPIYLRSSVTWCEAAGEVVPCNTCTPCKRMLDITL